MVAMRMQSSDGQGDIVRQAGGVGAVFVGRPGQGGPSFSRSLPLSTPGVESATWMSFGVYLHFPFCLSKCPYCDFASVAAKPEHERYARAIAKELELRLSEASGRIAGSVYLGGGTPSLWAPPAAARALEAIRDRVAFAADTEATLEANPGAADVARFESFRKAGLNRLSIGVQSFDDQVLQRLGRRHSSREAMAAVDAARGAGFDNVALDLIYGAPGQTVAMARADARQAVSLGVEHLSCYALTLEHLAVEVPMAQAVREGRLVVPVADLQWEMGHAIDDDLRGAGFGRYEISNWCRPGRQARHNRLYWTGGEYLGLGAGASGFALCDPQEPSRGGRRWCNHRDPARYLAEVEADRLPEAQSEPLDAATLLSERLAIGLRQVDGVDALAACQALGRDSAPTLAAARLLERRGLATLRGGVVALTERGLDFHSEAALAFV
jgi:oxygen-independent coproporphyrinogen-3 oxidase